MEQPNRNYTDGTYRYGFQGQEKDDELKGKGNSVNYKYRIHDPRLGRFFAVDPLAKEYTWNSSYAFSENRVVDGIELEGREYFYYIFIENFNGQPMLLSLGKEDIETELIIGSVTLNLGEGNFVMGSDGDWRIIPYEYLSKSLSDVTFDEIDSWGTKDEVLAGINFLTEQGKKAELAISVVEGFDGLWNIYRGLRQIFKGKKGGPHKSLPTKKHHDRHEMPSNSVLAKLGLGKNFGGSVQLKFEAHLLTGSFANTKLSRAFKLKEFDLLKAGKYDEAWKFLENDFWKAVDGAGEARIDYIDALKDAKKVFYDKIVPVLKETAKTTKK